MVRCAAVVAAFFATLALITSVIEIGFRVGRRERNRTGHGADTQVGLAVTSVLGLVAFIVGFALGLAETRYESRREAKFSEADAVSTARNEMSSTGAPSTTIMAARTPSEGEPGGEMTS